jgi:predicted transcriptional regulator
MPTNYERVMKRFIPAFRLKAAKMMVNEYKIKQQKVASILGTTQAAVSKYLTQNIDKYPDIEIDSKMLKEFIEKSEVNQTRSAQKIMCTVCQNNKKFDCTFIVK